MEDIRLLKLRASLTQAMEAWIEKESIEPEWDGLGTYTGDFTAELMANSAFNILLAQSDLSEYLTREDLLK